MLRRTLLQLLPAGLVSFFSFDRLKPAAAPRVDTVKGAIYLPNIEHRGDCIEAWTTTTFLVPGQKPIQFSTPRFCKSPHEDHGCGCGPSWQDASPGWTQESLVRAAVDEGARDIAKALREHFQLNFPATARQEPGTTMEYEGLPANARFQAFMGGVLTDHHDGEVYAECEDTPSRTPSSVKEPWERVGYWMSAYPDVSKEPEDRYPRKRDFRLTVERQIGTAAELVELNKQHLLAALRLSWEKREAMDQDGENQKLLQAMPSGALMTGITHGGDNHPTIRAFRAKRQAMDREPRFCQGGTRVFHLPYRHGEFADLIQELLSMSPEQRQISCEEIDRSSPILYRDVQVGLASHHVYLDALPTETTAAAAGA